MKSNNYKILVLSDLKEKTNQTLSYAANLSKEIDAEVELFYVQSITDVLDTESSLRAISVINEAYNKIEKKIKSIVRPISQKTNTQIKTSYAFGNIKNEIENRILNDQPDMIILGEREQKRFNFFGDNITRFVEKKYDGVLLVATDKNVLDSEGNVSLNNLGLKDNLSNYKADVKKKVMAKV